MTNVSVRYCEQHGETLFQWKYDFNMRDGGSWRCKECDHYYRVDYYAKHNERDRVRDRAHMMGINRPMSEAKNSSSYLGVYVAERIIAEPILKQIFGTVTWMPYGNPGYDAVCGDEEYKIDVKSGCLHKADKSHNSMYWNFWIKNNTIADRFLCVAINNRESLDVQHVWLIPGNVVNHLKQTLTITNSDQPLSKWKEYEKSFGNVPVYCSDLTCADAT